MAPLVRTGGSRHTGLAALPHRNIHLAWSSVLLALGNIKGEVVERPKALGDIRGVTYIYGMFYRFGLINVPDKVKEKMGRPINRKN